MERVTRRLPSAVAASLCTTTAAQFGVLPVQIASFHILSPISILTNAVVLPFIPLTMVVGFGVAVFPHAPLVGIAYALVHLLILIAVWAAGLGTAVSMTSLPLPISLLYYSILSIAALAAWRLGAIDRRMVQGEWLFGLSVAAIGLGVGLSAPLPGSRLTVITAGDALISGHGQHVLIDGGTNGPQLLAGLGSALPYSNGRLDAVIDTNPAAKNVASLLDVAQHLAVGEVVDPGIEYPSQTYARWRAGLSARQVPVLALRAGLTVHGQGFTIQCLAPDGIYSNPKDGAGILLITLGSERILYLGDASAKEQQSLPFRTSTRAGMVISAAPLEPVLARSAGDPGLVHPVAGTVIVAHP